MKKLEFNPKEGYNSPSDFPNPNNESETREQIQRLHNQSRDFINRMIDTLGGEGGSAEIGSCTIEELKNNGTTAKNVADQIEALNKLKLFSTNFRYARIGSDNSIEYSNDGKTWKSVNDGILIYNGLGNQMPVRRKVMIKNATLTDNGDSTVIVAAKGDKGDPGRDGIDGRSFIVRGSYNTLEELKQAHPTGNDGDAYNVGVGSERTVYVWNMYTGSWEDVGPISGPIGQGVPKGGTTGQVLRKKSDIDYDTEFVEATVYWGKITGNILDQLDLKKYISKIQSETITVTINPSDWSEDKKYTINNAKITETSNQEILGPIDDGTPEISNMYKVIAKADIRDAGQSNGQAFIRYAGTKPNIAIKLRVVLRGDK